MRYLFLALIILVIASCSKNPVSTNFDISFLVNGSAYSVEYKINDKEQLPRIRHNEWSYNQTINAGDRVYFKIINKEQSKVSIKIFVDSQIYRELEMENKDQEFEFNQFVH